MMSDRDEQMGISEEEEEMVAMQPEVDQLASLASAVFRMFGWQYGGHELAPVVSHERLRRVIAALAIEAERSKRKSAGSGRLLAECNDDDGTIEVYVSLGQFVTTLDDE